MKSGMSLASNYAGVFLVDGHLDTVRHRDRLASDYVAHWVFQHPKGSVCFVLGDEHAEPVTSWLRTVHDIVIGSSMLAAPLTKGRRFPTPNDAYLFRLPILMLEELDLLTEIINPANFCLFLPHNSEIIILTSATDGLALLEVFPQLTHPLTGLVLRDSALLRKRKSASKTKFKSPYDPVGAQIREIRGPLSEAARQSIYKLIAMWQLVFHEQAPSDILQWQSFVTQIVEEIRDSGYEQPFLLKLIDSGALRLRTTIRRVNELSQGLRDYVIGQTSELQVGISYDEVASSLMLRAAGQYAKDIAQRLGIHQGRRFVILLGDDFRIGAVAPPHILHDQQHLVTLEIPREFQIRLGVLPILAHQLAHLVVDKHEKLISVLYEQHWGSPLLEELFSPLEINPAPTGPYEEEQYKRDEEVAYNWAIEALADLVATAVVGPSYIFSLARFAIGSLEQFVGQNRLSHTHPPFSSRIRLCLAFLKQIGNEIEFKSEFLVPSDQDLDPALVAEIAATINEPFGVKDQELDLVEGMLKSGQVAEARPVEIVGALWRAVARRSGYLNEIAATVSIANSLL